mmetsp:Transcript_26916/g.87140  ORF Transcript_26916/g.87140 Transcript_26916/m.87140 type:complete len:386 (-) Transcript_26916:56-1213(-)
MAVGAAREPAVVHPLRLLAYYRLDQDALADVPWPRPLRMRLLQEDGVSLAITATGLPFCGGPLWLRWVTRLWRGAFRGPLRTLEGGAEAGSCSLWAAAMLGDLADLRVIGVEPMPAAAGALRQSAKANGWPRGTVEVLEAALVNRSVRVAGRGNPTVTLSVAPGRSAEASAIHCVAGDRACSIVHVPALTLDELTLAPHPAKAADGRGSGRFEVIHCLKLNVMGFELDVLQGGADKFLLPPEPDDRGGSTSPRPLVCSVILDELKLDRGPEDVRRLGAIIRLLQSRGFLVEAFVRDHGEAARRAPHRLLLERIQVGEFGQVALRALHLLPVAARGSKGWVVAAWRKVGVAGGACRATEPPFRPAFAPEDFGQVLPRAEATAALPA